MKIGITPINVGGPATAKHAVEIAQFAESVGIESVWTFEHVVVPVQYASVYPYSRDGKMPAQPSTWFIDPLISLAHVAGATKKIRLGTGVNIFAQTNPMLFAKQTASLDALSQGRLTLGLGLGWLEEEFKAMGTPFAKRGARFDDQLAAVKKVWTGETVEHESEFLSWHGFQSHPTPAQKPHPPLLMGGTTHKALKRVVSMADGWYAASDTEDDLAKHLDTLRGFAAEAGRDFDSLDITSNWRVARNPDAVERLGALGVKRLVAMITSTGETDPKKSIEKIAKLAGL